MTDESQQEQLRRVLEKANRRTDSVDELHREFSLMYTEKALAPHVGRSPASTLRANATEFDELAASLARRLHFDADDDKGVFSPEFLELLGGLYEQHKVEKRVPSRDHPHPATQEIQWGDWRSRLSADLRLLKSLAAEALQTLPTIDEAPSEMPAVSKTDLVLRTRDWIPDPITGHRGGALPEVILDVMAIYDPKSEVTVDMVKGILRKEKTSS